MLTYSDLLLNFEPNDNTNPTSTQINGIIENLYKQLYGILEGKGSYSETDDIGDELESIIISAATRIVQEWVLSVNADNISTKYPSIVFNQNEADLILKFARRPVVGLVRMYESY